MVLVGELMKLMFSSIMVVVEKNDTQGELMHVVDCATGSVYND